MMFCFLIKQCYFEYSFWDFSKVICFHILILDFGVCVCMPGFLVCYFGLPRCSFLL